MPGCGKTTIGKIIAKELEMNFVDMDAYIEESRGTTITDMFKNGEAYFRAIESEAAKELSEREGEIISTGGGVIKNAANTLSLGENGIIIYINRPVEAIAKDIDAESRPLLAKDPSQLFKLFDERGLLYKEQCHYEVMNTSDIATVVKEIINIYKNASN